jgi:SAM-dependent methyltransferase
MFIDIDYQTPDRMDKKLRAIPIPDLAGKSVLDVGCDMGFWCRYALANGASQVVGLDRGRIVKGSGFVNLAQYCRDELGNGKATFHEFELGKQWREFGKFDLILFFSLYHHVYQVTGGDHLSIWYWLSRHMAPGGIVLWENPTDTDDPVVRMNVDSDYWDRYCEADILSAADRYFEVEYIGPSLHEITRSVFRFTVRSKLWLGMVGKHQPGAGGATAAFNYADGRRIREIGDILGVLPVPGSLNLKLSRDFDWNTDCYRAQVLDVVDRSAGLDSQWNPRWARFYPIELAIDAWAFRFEGENYPLNFVELISDSRLVDECKNGQLAMLR